MRLGRLAFLRGPAPLGPIAATTSMPGLTDGSESSDGCIKSGNHRAAVDWYPASNCRQRWGSAICIR